MTVIAEAEVIIRPVSQNFPKQLDAQVQQAVKATNKNAIISPKVDDKGQVSNFARKLQGLSSTGKVSQQTLDKFAPSLNKLDQGLQKVGKTGSITRTALDKLGISGGGLKSLFESGLVNATTAVGAALSALAIKGVRDFVQLGTEVRQFQIVSGATAEDASRLVAVSKALGVSTQAAGTGVFFLEKNLNTAGPKLQALGVDVVKTSSGALDLSKTFLNVADAVSRTEDPARRAQIAFTAFGRGGKALLPILIQGREGIKELFEEASKHGEILSQSQVNSTFRFKIALHDLNEATRHLGRDIGSVLVPALTNLASGFANALDKAIGLGEALNRKLPGGIGNFVNAALPGLGAANLLFSKTTSSAKQLAQEAQSGLEAVSAQFQSSLQFQGTLDSLVSKGVPLAVANQLKAMGTAGFEAATALDNAKPKVRDAFIALAQLATANDQAAEAEKHHINQLNALGPSITHAFGDTKHQVLEWQQGLTQSLNFVSTNLGSIASQLDQNAKDGSKAIQDATKASTSAQDRVQLAQDRLSIFQAKLHAQSTVSAADNAREKLLQDQLSQAKERAGTASEKLASAQRKDANASKEVLAAFDSQLHQMVVYRQNFDILLARHAPADLIKQLTDLGQSGSSVVAALAGANATQFEKILRDWRHARDQAPGVGHDIRKGFLKEGPIKIPVAFDLAQVRKEKGGAARSELIQALGTVKVPVSAALQVSTPSVTVEGTNVKVSVPPRMFGGPVSAGDPFLVGERGPELFVPNSSGSIVPNDRLRGGFSSQDVDRIIEALKEAVALSRPIQVTEVAQSPVATAEAVAARLGLAGVR